jgi:hypothetical protein
MHVIAHFLPAEKLRLARELVRRIREEERFRTHFVWQVLAVVPLLTLVSTYSGIATAFALDDAKWIFPDSLQNTGSRQTIAGGIGIAVFLGALISQVWLCAWALSGIWRIHFAPKNFSYRSIPKWVPITFILCALTPFVWVTVEAPVFGVIAITLILAFHSVLLYLADRAVRRNQ